MEIVLGSLIEWLKKRLKKHRVMKLVIVSLVFSFGSWLAYLEWVSR